MKLALGTAQFGFSYGVANTKGQVGQDEADRILAEAAGAGVDTIDTAMAYGESERTLGRIGVQGWKVVSKLPGLPLGCTEVATWVAQQVDASLARLGVDRLHALLLHRSADLLGPSGAELAAALQELKEQGRVRQLGVSVYSGVELESLLEHLPLDIVQAPLSILDRRLVDEGWPSRLRQRGCEFHARSVFLQGLLLMPVARRPMFFQRWASIWAEWERWLEARGLGPVEACLRYVLSVDAVDRVVVGVDGLAQWREILSVPAAVLPDLPRWPDHFEPELVNPACWRP